jgi:hypothetical protein
MAGRMTRIGWAELGGYAIAVAGVVAGVTFDAARPIFYLATGLMGLTLALVMLGFYELGGRTPRGLALVALTTSSLAVLVFATVFVVAAVGLVTTDATRSAEGALAVASVAMVVIGLWLIGAPVLAGPWLTPIPRWLGVVCGLAWALEGVGLLTGGSQNPLTTIGGIGVQLLFPIWGAVVGRRFAAIRSDFAHQAMQG